MSDAPSNLPFDPLDGVPLAPPSRPVSPPTPPAPPIPMAEPIVPPVRPVVPPVASLASDPLPPTRPATPPTVPEPLSASAAPTIKPVMAEDVFAGIETAPVVPATTRQQAPLPPLPVSEGHRTGILLVLVGFVVLAGAGGATWWFFLRPTPTVPVVQTTANGRDLPILPPPAQEPTTFDSGDVGTAPMQVVPLPEPVTTPPPGTSIPLPGGAGLDTPVMPTAPDIATSTTTTAPQPAVQFDTDGDGLTDIREQELGTSASRFDTDGDTLGDGQEVLSYSTNPLNTDTDSDGFPDGVEIQNGFNPRGTGRCSQPDCRL